jgi:carboxypeptidase D
MQDIAGQYPDITKLESIGQSVQGRELWVIEISDNPGVNEIEPEFKYVANMHGDETVGRELSLYLIEWLVEGYGNNQRATDLINNTDIFIMPTMNPDGFENGSRYNANGVDLNRDFPDQFTDLSNTVSGRQPETRAVMEWTWDHHFVLSANMHTGALVANYPFDGPNSGSYSASPDDDLFVHISRTYADAHPNMESGGFNNGITNGSQWYAIFGGMQDWNYVWEDDCDITLEQHEVKWPNSSQLAGLWEDHREPLLAYMEEVHDGVRGIVTDADTGLPLSATITVQGIDHDITPDPENGDYYRLLTPGTYTVTASAFGYLAQSETVTVPFSGSVELNFALSMDPWLAEAEIEDFETGAFENSLWSHSGDADWIIDTNTFFEGSFSGRSGSIDHSQQSAVSITLDVVEDGQISFYKKVSCENVGSSTGNFYDYLSFSIDGVEREKWAGEVDWSLESYPVSAGTHSFEWLFIKDHAVTSGSDAAWIDFVVFPPLASDEECGNGDINGDGTLNVLDVVSLVNCVLGDSCDLCPADMNQDSILNVLDVVLMVNAILGN